MQAASLFICYDYAETFSANNPRKVLLSTDQVPGIDQRVEEDFLEGYVRVAKKFGQDFRMSDVADDPLDSITQIKRLHDLALAKTKKINAEKTQSAWLAGMLGVLGVDEDVDLSDIEIDDEDDEDPDWDTEKLTLIHI